MKVVYVSTYGIRCGIAEYTKSLAKAVAEGDHQVNILANRPSEQGAQDHLVPVETLPESVKIVRAWDVEGWAGSSGWDMGLIRAVLAGWGPDIVHWQYQSFLFADELSAFISKMVRQGNAKLVATLHDSGIGQNFPTQAVDQWLGHSEDILNHAGVKGRVVPMGASYRKPVVATFGLGRSQSEKIRDACEAEGVSCSFEEFSWHNWVPKPEHLKRLRSADALALIFPKQPGAVVSSSMLDALVSYRPVLLTEGTVWFSTLPELPNVHRCPDTVEGIAAKLREIFGPRREYLEGCSWKAVANKHLEIYEEVLSGKAAVG